MRRIGLEQGYTIVLSMFLKVFSFFLSFKLAMTGMQNKGTDHKLPVR